MRRPSKPDAFIGKIGNRAANNRYRQIKKGCIRSPAFTFVLTMGIINLFGDVTYEGGDSR